MSKRLWYTALNATYTNPEERRLFDNVGNYSIDINDIAFLDKGCDDVDCRSKIISFLGDKGTFWKSIENDWGKICSFRKPEKVVFNEELINRLNQNSIFLFNKRIKYFNFAQGIYLDLQEQYTLKPDEFIDKEYFDYFFAYRLSRRDLNQVKEFLSFNFYYHFNQDIKKYCYFLTDIVLRKHAVLIGSEKVDLIKKIFIEDSVNTSRINPEEVSPTVVAYMILFIERTGEDINKEKLYKQYQAQLRPNDDKWTNTIKTSHSRLIGQKDYSSRHKKFIELALELLGDTHPKARLEGQKILKSLK